MLPEVGIFRSQPKILSSPKINTKPGMSFNRNEKRFLKTLPDYLTEIAILEVEGKEIRRPQRRLFCFSKLRKEGYELRISRLLSSQQWKMRVE